MDLWTTDSSGKLPLHHASAEGYSSIVVFVLCAEALVNAMSFYSSPNLQIELNWRDDEPEACHEESKDDWTSDLRNHQNM